MKILSVFGTRPEAIKMAPLVRRLSQEGKIKSICTVTAQHRQMLDQVLNIFGIKPEYDLNIMTKNQPLQRIAAKCMEGLLKIYKKEKPDLVLVQGDTTTTLAGALSAHYSKIPVGHVEAGLRSGDPFNPFPEENNRRLTDILSTFNFAPTQTSRRNLLKDNISESSIFVTGNTVIDALMETSGAVTDPSNPQLRKIDLTGRIVLVTAHRRENLGQGIENICQAVKKLAKEFEDVLFIYPVHMNPAVKNTVARILRGRKNILLLTPISYPDMVWLLQRVYMCMSDSGGIQEEAPALGKPVIVLRKVTERPEAVEAGTVKVAGTDTDSIVKAAGELLSDSELYGRFSKAVNPFGDGKASERITSCLLNRFGFAQEEPEQWKI